METLIVPLVKDKKESLEDKNNYRPIAITNVLSKVLENILYARCEEQLTTTDNQFGFKSASSTDLCIYAFKETTSYYNSLSSPVYACYMDLSKAFDRVNYWILLDKLLQRGMPRLYARLFCYWFTHQQFAIRWNGMLSQFFSISNGVRQGGVLSPIFFNVFIDDLSCALRDTEIGCFIGNVCLNHLCYADDMVLLAPSPCALQQLLNVCYNYAAANDLSYNTKKTKCMTFFPDNLKYDSPTFKLNNVTLPCVDRYKYLGVIISPCKTDKFDIQRAVQSQYTNGNRLTRKFNNCTKSVKIRLFQTYCSSFYGAHLWCNYTKKSLQSVKVAYNSSYRSFLTLKRDSSISFHQVQNNVTTFDALRRKNIYNFMLRLDKSSNSVIQSFRNTLYYCYVSPLEQLWWDVLHMS